MQKKILVERALIGTDHTDSIFAICWDCLDPEKQDRAREKYNLHTEA